MTTSVTLAHTTVVWPANAITFRGRFDAFQRSANVDIDSIFVPEIVTQFFVQWVMKQTNLATASVGSRDTCFIC